MTTFCNIRQVPYCCGVYEAGNFDRDWVNDDDDDVEINGDTVEELLQKILIYSNGRPVIFNFVKRRDWVGTLLPYYDANDLRQLVQKHSKVVHLAKFINPSSQNRIDSYMIKDYKDE